jgi:glyoxylase-like metal-dependent hydrolase (beta-lactamase superfamily II)
MRRRGQWASACRLATWLVLAAVALFLRPAGINAQQTPTAPPAADSTALTRIADDVYVFRHNTYQALFIVTDEGVIATDPIGLLNPQVPTLYKAAIASVTPQPVRYVVYGHDHADHITGGDVFADTAQFVSQQLAAPRIAARADPRTPVPTITFDDHLTLTLGGKTVDLYYPGRAHSDNDLVLVYPARRVAFVADVIAAETLPPLGGNPDDYVAYLRWIEDNLDFDTLVAGHGAIGGMHTVRQLRTYLEDLIGAVRTARAQALTDDSVDVAAAVRAALAPRYAGWEHFDRLDRNVAAVLRSQAAN